MKKDTFIIKLNPVDALTLGGLVLALTAAVLVMEGRFAFALSFLFMAMLVDGLDGIAARKFGSERAFGRYLDGFVDVFDYLAVPSLFLFMWGFSSWYYSIFLAVFIICGIIRLSVFNDIGNIKDEDDGLSYLGMPVFWSVFLLGGSFILSWFVSIDFIFPAVAIALLLYSFLMLYNGRFYKVKSWKVMLAVVISASLLFAFDGWGLFNFSAVSGAGFTAFNSLQINQHIFTALLIIFPGLIGGILHMIAVSRDWFSFLKIPVSRFLFGENKTLRGFILMPLFSIPGAFLGYQLLGDLELTIAIEGIHFVELGLLIGFVYVLFELPNSFIKRRMGIAPGDDAPRFRRLFIFFDQIDSSLGAAVVSLLLGAPLLTAACILAGGPVVAFFVKRLLYVLKLKKTSR